MTNSIYWYDFETFGINPQLDRLSQFAGIRTDEDLNIISDPLTLYCKPAEDCLPDPHACLITGITPQKALADGINEAEFIAAIHKEFLHHIPVSPVSITFASTMNSPATLYIETFTMLMDTNGKTEIHVGTLSTWYASPAHFDLKALTGQNKMAARVFDLNY